MRVAQPAPGRLARLFFWKKPEKWHEVRWFHGDRDIYLAIQFADDDRPVDEPTVERLPSKDAAANAAQPALDEKALVQAIAEELKAYNRRNLCSLKLAAIKYRAKGGADEADHGSAARKLLNLL